MSTYTLLQATAEAAAPGFPVAAVAVLGVGFIAAVSLGSIAWFNSKRPPGWEDKERPDIVPDIEVEK